MAPINNLGYGVAGYNILKELVKIDPRVTLYPIGRPENMPDIGVINSAINNQTLIRKDFPCIKIWHQNDLFASIGRAKYFGFPIFELNEFNEIEKCSIKHCDNIMVCSKWAKDIILNNNMGFRDDQVHVINLGVDRTIFNETYTPVTKPKTIFFNCGKWEKRKGHDILVHVFNQAFDHYDDVELWMMPENPFIGKLNDQWANLYKSSKLGQKIKIIPRQESQIDVFNIMKQVDCGVFPARAEGWNLELLELMSCGKHVITTDYSAHTEFCNKNNAMLVNIDNLETAFDGVFFSGEYGQWAEISVPQQDQLIDYLRVTHKKKQQNQLDINTAGIETAKSFSWEKIAKEILDVVGF